MSDGQSHDPVKAKPVPLEAILAQQSPEVLKSLPKKERAKIANVHIEASIVRVGPLPDPHELERYNAIIPNGADRIMKMAEEQSRHRMELERKVISGQLKQTDRGQNYGLIIALVGLAISGLLGYFGQGVAASFIGGGTLVSLVTVFVLGRKKQEKDLAAKRPKQGN